MFSMVQSNKVANLISCRKSVRYTHLRVATEFLMNQLLRVLIIQVWLACPFSLLANHLPQTINSVKPSIVAIAIEDPIGPTRYKLLGTGFAINDGSTIVTNAHMFQANVTGQQRFVVLSGQGNTSKNHMILKHKVFEHFDLALLTIDGKLPALKLASDEPAAEGTDLAFTGYPITDVLGLYPATHRATLSAVTPIVIPQISSQSISAEMVRLLRDPIVIYQLDATAYPGNSGSPLFDVTSGHVVGIINMVYVKRTKEAVLADPSGISYAIPVHYLHFAIAHFNDHE